MTDLSMPSLADVLFDPDRDAAIAGLAAAGPVLRGRYLDGSAVWLVTGYAECLAVLGDRRFSNDPARSSSVDIGAAFPDDVRPYLLHTLGANDPPEHTRLRRQVSAQFTARRVQHLRGRITEITEELLDDIALATGEVDLIETFAYPLPIRVICELLGVPADDHDRWRAWSTELSAPDPDRMVAGARGLIGYIGELVETKRRMPGEDLLSALVAAHDDRDSLGTDELVSVAITILTAGHETTVNLLANAVSVLLTDPDRAQALRRDPNAIPRAVEELLRYCGPADIAVLRYPTEPVTVGGQLVCPGEPVQIVYAAANRDHRRFTEPEHVDLARRDNPHLGLGHGIHYCLGAALARAEADIALERLLTRYPDLALARPATDLAWQPGISRGLGRLPVLAGAGASRARPAR